MVQYFLRRWYFCEIVKNWLPVLRIFLFFLLQVCNLSIMNIFFPSAFQPFFCFNLKPVIISDLFKIDPISNILLIKLNAFRAHINQGLIVASWPDLVLRNGLAELQRHHSGTGSIVLDATIFTLADLSIAADTMTHITHFRLLIRKYLKIINQCKFNLYKNLLIFRDTLKS